MNRKDIYEKYSGHCAYCGKEIAISDMQIDHIIPKRIGGNDDQKNLNPSCRRCNHYKRGNKLEHYRDDLMTIQKRLAKEYLFKVAIDYGIVSITPFDGVFYFEKL